MDLYNCVSFHDGRDFVGSTTALNGATRVTIIVGDNEPIENALKRFKREANKSGHLRELRHRRHFENGQEKKKRKIREAGMRRRFERINRQRNAARMNRT